VADLTAHHENPEHGRTQETVLELTRQFLAQLHPGAPRSRVLTLDSDFERDLGLDSLSRVELAARIERAFEVSLPEHALAGAATLRDLVTALQNAPGIPSAVGTPHCFARRPAHCGGRHDRL